MGRVLVVALSGRVCAGKTTLSVALAARRGWAVLSTRDVVAQHLRRPGRGELQAVGHDLDAYTAGLWVAEALGGVDDLRSHAPGVVVDAVRIRDQVAGLRRSYRVIHAHLVAPLGVLTARYEEKRVAALGRELASYEIVAADPAEAGIEALAAVADTILDTHLLSVDKLADEIDRLTERMSRD